MMMRDREKVLNDNEVTLAKIWIDDNGLHIEPISNNYKQKENEQDCIKKDGSKELQGH